MREITISFPTSDDQFEVSLRTDEGGKEMTAEILERAIQALAIKRSETEPAVPTDPPIGRKTAASYFPPWYVQPDFERGSVILYRHAGLGWTGFSINPEQARRLAQLLLSQNQEDDPRPESVGHVH